MPSTIIKGSPNITVLDSKIVSDLCVGKFFVDITPSSFIGTGADNIHGVKIKIENPYHVPVKEYDVTYDISDPLTGVFAFNIPTQGGGYQAGTYIITAQLEDSTGALHEVSKDVVVCEPNPKQKLLKYGEIGANLSGICVEAKLRVIVNNPPTYRGIVSQSQIRAFTLIYPAGSNIPPKTTGVTTFSTYLFDGTYKLSGEVCATYLSTDNISYKVRYLVKIQKEIRCTIDECCVFRKLAELHERLAENCTPQQMEETSSITLDVLRLLETAKLASACGEDASDYIKDLEDLLQCSCSVLSVEGTPLSNNTPSKDFVIEGCNVDKDVTGLTTTYTINNFEYIVSIPDNGGALIVSAPMITDCVKKQTITFDMANVYSQVKNYANTSLIEANAWSAIINKSLNGLDTSALGITSNAWAALTFAQKIQEVIKKINKCCNCDSSITAHSYSLSGNDIVIDFDADAYSVDIYLDNNFVDNIIMPTSSYTLIDAADGARHEYTLVPKCANGSLGVSVQGEFNDYGCPYVQPPTLESYNVQNATCPFDLNSLYVTRPDTLSIEYHNANNVNPASMIQPQDAEIVGTGVYYAFHKNEAGCYSEGVKITINCINPQCSAPVNLNVIRVNGGFLVHFQSAVNPPSGNAYIVKRKARNAADAPGNYTTIGVTGSAGITWNPTANRWEILDTTAQDNVQYTYVAVSDCGATQPYVSFDFSNYSSCPIITGLAVSMEG